MMLDLTLIKGRLAAVPTPPWGEFCESGDWWIQQRDEDGSPIGTEVCGSQDMPQSITDLLLHAPTDMTALIAEVERLRAELTAVRERCAALTQAHCSYCTEQRIHQEATDAP